MYIYRLQTRDGRGPYQSYLVHDILDCWPYAATPRHPEPYHTPAGRRFGFADKHQMLEWFNKDELLRAYELNMEVVRITVDSHQVLGDIQQVQFDPDAVLESVSLPYEEAIDLDTPD